MRLAAACALLATTVAALPALAGQVKETKTYFMVRGSTFDELDRAMGLHGPGLRGGGERHAGSTQVSFTGDATYKTANGRCGVDRASYRLTVHQTLPRWSAPKGADDRTRLLWKTQRDDIETHENRHSAIARAALRRLEASVRDLAPMADCDRMTAKVDSVVERVIAEHDREQQAFDAAEARVMDSRLARELKRNLARAAAN